MSDRLENIQREIPRYARNDSAQGGSSLTCEPRVFEASDPVLGKHQVLGYSRAKMNEEAPPQGALPPREQVLHEFARHHAGISPLVADPLLEKLFRHARLRKGIEDDPASGLRDADHFQEVAALNDEWQVRKHSVCVDEVYRVVVRLP